MSESHSIGTWVQDFPEEGTPTPEGAQTNYLTNFFEHCMKIKKFWPKGSPPPIKSATASYYKIVLAIHPYDMEGNNLT